MPHDKIAKKADGSIAATDGDRYAHKGFLNRLPPSPSECHGVEEKSCEVQHPDSRRQRSVASDQAGREFGRRILPHIPGDSLEGRPPPPVRSRCWARLTARRRDGGYSTDLEPLEP